MIGFAIGTLGAVMMVTGLVLYALSMRRDLQVGIREFQLGEAAKNLAINLDSKPEVDLVGMTKADWDAMETDLQWGIRNYRLSNAAELEEWLRGMDE